MSNEDIRNLNLLINKLQTLIDLLNKIKSEEFSTKYICKRMISDSYIMVCNKNIIMEDLGFLYCDIVKIIADITKLKDQVEV